EWATAWSAVADGYMVKAKAAGDPKEADANFVRAWRLYYFAQWPAPTSNGKKAAYERAIDAYLQHARNFDPPLEVVRIPFRSREIVGYLRLPAKRAPSGAAGIGYFGARQPQGDGCRDLRSRAGRGDR